MKRKIIRIKNYWGWLLVLILSFLAIKPLLQPGFFSMHDDTQVVRVYQMAQALKDGQFPVRWVEDLGYGFGYPIFNFYAPLAYYCGAFFILMGFDALVATKLMFILGIVISGITMYFLGREFWGEMGGVLSGLFYIYAPYHALDIYVRGAVGEFWAMALLPLVFLGIWKIYQAIEKKKARVSDWKRRRFQGLNWVGFSSLSFAAVILSHNLTAMMAIPFLLLTGLVALIFSNQRKLFTFHFLLFTILALALSAFYWLPALVEMNLTKVSLQVGGGADFSDHFVFLDQLWSSPWGFAGSASGRLDGMSFMIGKLHLGFSLVALLLSGLIWLTGRSKLFSGLTKTIAKSNRVVIMAFGGLLLSIFFTNQVSSPIWELIPPMAYLQYPWRFLIFATLSASFLAGFSVKLVQDSSGLGNIPGRRWIFGLLVILGLLKINGKYFQPQFLYQVTAAGLIQRERIITETSRISDEYLPREFPVPVEKSEMAWEKVQVTSGRALVEVVKMKAQELSFRLIAATKAEVVVNLAYFPGWEVGINSQLGKFTVEQGRIKLQLPPGQYHVKVILTNTPIRNWSNLITLGAVASLAYTFNWRKQFKRRSHQKG